MGGEMISSALQQSPCEDSNPPPAKKKRNLPGTPDPEAEVVALSPKTLLATNRFICEICGKGFQRDQNLQLHRRGHNLPWKLKQRSSKEPRKRVYVCPEKSCVHHHSSRALGDLTGIKKHYSRKHGEKKWKCDKCSKRYAVQSDWKAHMKTCGTREYRCDCGTLFSRRDSFITHRAFCDALAEETARICATSSSVSCVTAAAINSSTLGQPLPSAFNATLLSDLHSPPPAFFHDSFPARANPNLLSTSLPTASNMKQHFSCSPSLFSGQQQRPNAPPPDMSATALLQKAAQMGVAAVDPPFLWSLYTKNTEGAQVEDCNKFESLFAVNSTGFNDTQDLSQLQNYRLTQREEIGGQTRDFLGVNVQAVCPTSINGWI